MDSDIYVEAIAESRSFEMSWSLAAPKGQNYIMNGDFSFWQRGTSFAATGPTADRWVRALGAATGSTSRQSFTLGQTDVPGEPQYYLRSAVNNANGATPTLYQSIEGVETLVGQEVTVSFYAWADASRVLSIFLIQNFGTGGSPSTAVAVSSTVNLTTTAALYTVTFNLGNINGKTIGTNGNDCLQLVFAGPAVTNFATLNFSQVKLEAGGTATSFTPLPPALGLALCQRYYEKSFAVTSTPAQNFGIAGALEFPALFAGSTQQIWSCPFKVQKRAVPTMTWYSPSNVSAQVFNETLTAQCTGTLTVGSTGTSGFVLAFNGFNFQAIGDRLAVHWTADCELP